MDTYWQQKIMIIIYYYQSIVQSIKCMAVKKNYYKTKSFFLEKLFEKLIQINVIICSNIPKKYTK